MQLSLSPYTIYTLVILFLAYGVVRGYIFFRDRKLKQEIREKSIEIAGKICNILSKENAIKKRFISPKGARELLRFLNKQPKATIVKKLVFKLNYYVRVSKNKPDVLRDRQYIREKVIYPIMHELGVFLSQINRDIKKIWESVPKRKRYREQDTVLPELFTKICEYVHQVQEKKNHF